MFYIALSVKSILSDLYLFLERYKKEVTIEQLEKQNPSLKETKFFYA